MQASDTHTDNYPYPPVPPNEPSRSMAVWFRVPPRWWVFDGYFHFRDALRRRVSWPVLCFGLCHLVSLGAARPRPWGLGAWGGGARGLGCPVRTSNRTQTEKRLCVFVVFPGSPVWRRTIWRALCLVSCLSTFGSWAVGELGKVTPLLGGRNRIEAAGIGNKCFCQLFLALAAAAPTHFIIISKSCSCKSLNL